MRHPLVTIQLISKARDAAIAQAQADERLEHWTQATPDAQPAERGGSLGSEPWPAASAPWWKEPADRRAVLSRR
jgi:hypothetical protein